MKLITEFLRKRRIKRFTKLRQKAKRFEVQCTSSRFGSFYYDDKKHSVVALSAGHAVYRLNKRGIFATQRLVDDNLNSYKVHEAGKPKDMRYISFFKY